MKQLAYIFWDPDPDLFQMPIIDMRVTWYGLLFSLGFWIGFHIFVHLFTRFLCRYVEFQKGDINKKQCQKNALFQNLEIKSPKDIYEKFCKEKKVFLDSKQKKLLQYSKESFGEAHMHALQYRFYLENAFPKIFISIKQRARMVGDTLMIYVLLAAVIGARLCHVFFYEDFWLYLQNPVSILKTWEGGLASHGGIIAIILALALFRWQQKQHYKEFTFFHILDGISIPTMFVAGVIRIGNFFNQEILGVSTQKPWGIIFGHPVDGIDLIPRHPAQLYEMIIYWSIFATLMILWHKKDYKIPAGIYAGIAIFFAFFTRFFVEYCKVEQSNWFIDEHQGLLMGQILSIPCIMIGLYLIFRVKLEKFFVNKIPAVLAIKRSERK